MSSLEFLFTLLSAAIAGIIGVILLLIGRKPNRRKLYRFGLAVVLTSFIALLVEFREIREVLIAFAVIAAAIVAAYSMDEARRLRQDNVDRERSDRKERLLNEIIEWASNVAKSAISRQAIDVSELWKAKLEHKFHKSKGKYINVIVSSSFKELSDSFKDANIKLDEAIDFLERILSGKGGNVLSLKDYETAIADSAEKVIKEAAKIKTRDIR